MLSTHQCSGMAFPPESVLNVCVYASFQLPLVLDNHSEGIDIRFWVKVISATSDRLEEVSHGFIHNFTAGYFQEAGNSCFLSPSFHANTHGGRDMEAKFRSGLLALKTHRYHHHSSNVAKPSKTEAKLRHKRGNVQKQARRQR